MSEQGEEVVVEVDRPKSLHSWTPGAVVEGASAAVPRTGWLKPWPADWKPFFSAEEIARDDLARLEAGIREIIREELKKAGLVKE